MFGARWRKDFSYYRPSAGPYLSGGRQTEPTYTLNSINAVIQPAKSDMMTSLQLSSTNVDDKIIDGGIFIFTSPDSQLYIESDDQKADLIQFNGSLYRVVDEGDFSHLSSSQAHYKYMAVRTQLSVSDLDVT